MKIPRFILSAYLICALIAPPAIAFKTFFPFPNYHGGILDNALKPLGVLPESIELVEVGARSQDIITSNKFLCSPINHGDDCTFRQSYGYITERINKAVGLSHDAYKNPESVKQTLYCLGEGFHTLQDFYSHTNYVEQVLRYRWAMEPVNWQRIPAGTTSGYFYWHSGLDNEVTRGRSAIVANLLAKHPTLQFRSQAEYDARKSSSDFDGALDYALKPGALMHFELNKDSPKEMQGKIVDPKSGKTLFFWAYHLAAEDTRRHWQIFASAVKKAYPKTAPLILSALKGKHPSIQMALTMPETINAGDSISSSLQVEVKDIDDPVDIYVRQLNEPSNNQAEAIYPGKLTGTFKIDETIKVLKPETKNEIAINFLSAFDGDREFDPQQIRKVVTIAPSTLSPIGNWRFWDIPAGRPALVCEGTITSAGPGKVSINMYDKGVRTWFKLPVNLDGHKMSTRFFVDGLYEETVDLNISADGNSFDGQYRIQRSPVEVHRFRGQRL